MKKTVLAKGMEMVESEREIREVLISKSEKNSGELYGMENEAEKHFRDLVRGKSLSRTTRRELSKYARYLDEMNKLAKNLSEFNALLMITRAERAEPERKEVSD